ncbi:MAG: hypothetical protein K5896_01425 [Prevotella sp.]|nr:hypothetical protein [Prevotella sp.]
MTSSWFLFAITMVCLAASVGKGTKKREKHKGKELFLLPPSETHRRELADAKLRKKLVKAKRFWKINAIQPKIKARRGRMKKFNLGLKANWGGLVKEFGCQIVTRKMGSEAG